MTTKPSYWQAFAIAQADFKPLLKTESNKHFNSKYADLAGAWDSVRDALQAQGFIAHRELMSKSEHNPLTLCVTLRHVPSGESQTVGVPLPDVTDPQKLRSAITYAARTGLECLCHLCPDDDDGNAAASSLRGQQQALGSNLQAQAAPPADGPPLKVAPNAAERKRNAQRWIDAQLATFGKLTDKAELDTILATQDFIKRLEALKKGQPELAEAFSERCDAIYAQLADNHDGAPF